MGDYSIMNLYLWITYLLTVIHFTNFISSSFSTFFSTLEEIPAVVHFTHKYFGVFMHIHTFLKKQKYDFLLF